MEAGARQIAAAKGEPLSPEYMDAVLRTQQRHAQLRRWENDGKVRVDHTWRYQNGNVRYKHDGLDERDPGYSTIIVRPRNRDLDAVQFTDKEAEANGSFPSEVLIANIALYLQSIGEL